MRWGSRVFWAVERFLEVERDQLPLWLPVFLGSGVAAWFALGSRNHWIAWLAATSACALASVSLPAGSRIRRVGFVAALSAMAGCALIWWRADAVAAPVIGRPQIVAFEGRVLDIDDQSAKDRFRIVLQTIAPTMLPPRVRLNVDRTDMVQRLLRGDRVRLRARLIGPQGASLPGGFDFARLAWFQQLGATGKAIGPVGRIGPPASGGATLRERLSTHIRSRLVGSAGGIASAFASGDRGGIDQADEDAMRASGLTHLLSVSGLHVTAVVGAVMFLTLRLFAASATLALRLPLLLVSAGAGALAGIGYTLLTGAEVPTVRSCVASLLVLAGVAIGREAFTLRLVAVGALIILILWPESLIGPSFQLSFAAITTIVALHELPLMRRLAGNAEHGRLARLGRAVASLLLTGLAVEVALAPIALFHFHKAGIFGAFANIIAIPLTTFVIMPTEAAALLLDMVGWGMPCWWLTGLAIDALLLLAHKVAELPFAQGALADIPLNGYATVVLGGLWLMLWRGGVRVWGLLPVIVGSIWTMSLRPPDLLVTGDGMHMAVRGGNGSFATLRPRAGDYIRSVMRERGGSLAELEDIDEAAGSTCTRDACRSTVSAGGRDWHVLATRSPYILPPGQLRADCSAADVVVSSRRLPPWCRPRWFKADRAMLEKTGGIAITFAAARVATVAENEGEHPWVLARRIATLGDLASRPRQYRRSSPASLP